jgi:O-antigen/teichoic acid export membrane protein
VKLVRHTLFNLAGLGLPMLVALACIPPLLGLLGSARFGLLSLIWAVVSYFSLFDLGLGRALTQRMAQRLAHDPAADVAPVAGTALALMLLVALAAAAGMALLASPGVALIRGVPDHAEAVRALLAMAMAVPAVVLATGLRGMLEARHAFGLVNLIRVPLGVYTFVAPLAVATWLGPRLDLIAVALLAGRVVTLAVHFWAVRLTTPGKHLAWTWQRSEVRPLLGAGGWLTVGSLVGPLMGYADRFVIAAAISAAAVAVYATPNELVTKLWIVPGAMTAALFPAFSAAAARRDGQAPHIAQLGMAWLYVVLLPLTLLLALFAHELLSVWINPAFAQDSAPLLKVMALGILVNCMAHVPLTWLQGAGHVRGPAVLQLVQVAPYLALLWWASATFGLIGTACMWAARMVLDTLAMFWLCARMQRREGLAPLPWFGAVAPALAGGAAFGLALFWQPAFEAKLEAKFLTWGLATGLVLVLLRPWQARMPVAKLAGVA